jgi:hypothetical protein
MRTAKGIKGIKAFKDVGALRKGWHVTLGTRYVEYMDMNVMEAAVELSIRYQRDVELTGFQGNTVSFRCI